jgi:hypothetical protein
LVDSRLVEVVVEAEVPGPVDLMLEGVVVSAVVVVAVEVVTEVVVEVDRSVVVATVSEVEVGVDSLLPLLEVPAGGRLLACC